MGLRDGVKTLNEGISGKPGLANQSNGDSVKGMGIAHIRKPVQKILFRENDHMILSCMRRCVCDL